MTRDEEYILNKYPYHNKIDIITDEDYETIKRLHIFQAGEIMCASKMNKFCELIKEREEDEHKS